MRELKLTGKGNHVAFVDDEDFDRLSQYKWYASLESRRTKVYAKRWKQKKDDPRWEARFIRLHHFILDLPPSQLPEDHVVNHKNDNGLDCQKENLEVITQTENMRRSRGWNKKIEEPAL